MTMKQHDCLTCAAPLPATRGTFCSAACGGAWEASHPQAVERREPEPQPFITASVPDATAERLAQWTAAMTEGRDDG